MDKPIYEIPVTPPGANVAGWTPGVPSPINDSAPGGRRRIDESVPFVPPAYIVDALPPAGAPLDAPPPAGAPMDAPAPAYDAPAPAYTPPPAYTAPPAYTPPAYEPPPATPAVAYEPPATPDAAAEPDGYTPPPAYAPPAAPAAAEAPEVPVERPALPIDDTLSESERALLKQADPDLLAALQEVVFQGASDLHMTANASPMLRVDGGLRPAGDATPWSRPKLMAALGSILTPQQKTNFERELELDFAYTISANARFRVNYYQQRGSVGAAFRIIPTEIKVLKDLGVPDSVGNFSKLARGLVLVTGPTGSGKSTTLAAMIDLVNSTRADHIVTVEDPIEFLHNHKKSIVNQREVGADTHSFAAALKHVLRQDPDVILIGELRDLETISVALTAAETGHLVFATLHTQDAPGTIDRVIDVFPPHQQGQVRAQLAATLQGVVCQTLVKRANGKGRAVATEVLVTTPAIANLIREGKTYQIASMMQAGRGQGMHTMDQHLADLVNSGVITHQAALDKAHDPEGIGRLIQRVESPTEVTARAMAAGGIDFGDTYSGVIR
ncbi:MAG: twitching motility protein PilT [Microbacteriaceae bacterium]|jgi:twitching motility protein PilT|nr:twitching motility protein PilT [Microbacteriaceae bacterium]